MVIDFYSIVVSTRKSTLKTEKTQCLEVKKNTIYYQACRSWPLNQSRHTLESPISWILRIPSVALLAFRKMFFGDKLCNLAWDCKNQHAWETCQLGSIFAFGKMLGKQVIFRNPNWSIEILPPQKKLELHQFNIPFDPAWSFSGSSTPNISQWCLNLNPYKETGS